MVFRHPDPEQQSGRFRQPQDDVAVALARAADGAQAVDEARLQPDLPLAFGVGLAFEAGRPEESVAAIAPKAAAVVMRSMDEI